MGFTPAGGLVMGTRPGDLDPGVPLYLLAAGGISPATLGNLINHQAGLLGVSGTGSDMRDLLAREARDPRAGEAVALFCYTARKYLGALAAALGGLDTLVFTGGIGEHAAPVRERICAGLEFLGIQLDPARNAASVPIISRGEPDGSQRGREEGREEEEGSEERRDRAERKGHFHASNADGAVGSAVTVRVMRTDEDLVIARHTLRLLREGDPHEGGTHALPL